MTVTCMFQGELSSYVHFACKFMSNCAKKGKIYKFKAMGSSKDIADKCIFKVKIAFLT